MFRKNIGNINKLNGQELNAMFRAQIRVADLLASDMWKDLRKWMSDHNFNF
jgi:hypothetical protein